MDRGGEADGYGVPRRRSWIICCGEQSPVSRQCNERCHRTSAVSRDPPSITGGYRRSQAVTNGYRERLTVAASLSGRGAATRRPRCRRLHRGRGATTDRAGACRPACLYCPAIVTSLSRASDFSYPHSHPYYPHTFSHPRRPTSPPQDALSGAALRDCARILVPRPRAPSQGGAHGISNVEVSTPVGSHGGFGPKPPTGWHLSSHLLESSLHAAFGRQTPRNVGGAHASPAASAADHTGHASPAPPKPDLTSSASRVPATPATGRSSAACLLSPASSFTSPLALSLPRAADLPPFPRHYVRRLWRESSPLPLDASRPLLVLYTSGSTGKPKGIVHTHGGYQVGLCATVHAVFAPQPARDVMLVVATPGWITGA